MNLILCEAADLQEDGTIALTGVRATHVREVLRAAAGDEVRVGIVDGPSGRGTIVSIADDRVDLRCQFDEMIGQVPPRPAIDLLLALPRPKVMRRLWAQLAAIGVGRIILTNASRVERHYFDTHILSQETYRPLLIEGLQQARDTRLPLVSIHRQFRILIEDDLDQLSDADQRLVAHPGDAPSIATAIAGANISAGEVRPARVLLAIGPEGGWNSFELDLLQRHRFTPIALGPRTLRTDTACIALLALLHASLDASAAASTATSSATSTATSSATLSTSGPDAT
jgi:16S rRNA (uracil1498-N3)-methyltransferase